MVKHYSGGNNSEILPGGPQGRPEVVHRNTNRPLSIQRFVVAQMILNRHSPAIPNLQINYMCLFIE